MIQCIPFFKNDISWFEILSSTIIPVSLFFVGLWFSKLMERYKEKAKQERLTKYFFGLISQLTKKISSQIKLLKDAAMRQDDPNATNLMTNIASGESHLLLREIDRNELYEAIVLSKSKELEMRTEMFEKIISEIDFVYKAIDVLEINNQSIPGIIAQQFDVSNNALMEIINKINGFKSAANDAKTIDNLIISIQPLLDNLESAKGNNPYIANIDEGYKIFVVPLIQILKDNSSDLRTPALMDLAQKAKLAYNRILDERQKNKKYFSLLADDLNNSLQTLTNDELKKINVAYTQYSQKGH